MATSAGWLASSMKGRIERVSEQGLQSRSRRWPVVLAGVALGAFAGLSAFAFYHGRGWSYLSNDPRACVNCHVMRDQYDGWQKSPHHAAATCNDCHVPVDAFGKYATKLEHGYRHSKGFTLDDFHEPIRITPSSLEVVEANCVRCHAELVAEIGGHAGGASCAACHRGIGHGAR